MIHLLHGIRTAGQAPILNLLPYLAGYSTAYPDYGWIEELETRVVNSIIVGAIKPYVKPSDVMIGHSNGCALIYELIQQVPVAGAVFINAALKQDITRPATCPWIHVYYNAGDSITELAQIGAEIGLVDKDWGEMGHAGYMGDDKSILNIDCGNTPGMPVVSGHHDLLMPPKVFAWGPYLWAHTLAYMTNARAG